MQNSIYKVGAIIFNDRKQILVVRKLFKDRTEFIIPGGKQEKDENDEQTLSRELKEELGISVKAFSFFGRFNEQAIFENIPLVMSVYYVDIDGQPSPQSEIKEYVWIDRDYKSKGYLLGSVLSKHIIPTLISRGQM
ncbi:MAG TPA: NUDIX domain-containing protein [Candidatus Paceibacterota bacterium]|jgi:8-oxo-dGTP diphosphatase|nr:NUDIX domain-containing protein [Candidatus Paceibacterota bacterium]